jgi:MYXO-CTERM domain-containing protein
MKNFKSFKTLAVVAVATLAGVAANTASSSIAQGGLMFTAVNTDNSTGFGDGFALVALTNIAAGEVVYITDNELTTVGATSFNTGESYTKWVTGNIAAGSVVVFNNFDSTTGTMTVSSGTAAALTFTGSANRGLSATADVLYLYQAASDATADTPLNHIAYLNIGNAVDGQISSSLNSAYAVSITTGENSAQYSGARNNQATFGAYAAQISNTANWTKVALATDPSTFNTTAFTVTPTPGTLALIAMGGAVAARRRRA